MKLSGNTLKTTVSHLKGFGSLILRDPDPIAAKFFEFEETTGASRVLMVSILLKLHPPSAKRKICFSTSPWFVPSVKLFSILHEIKLTCTLYRRPSQPPTRQKNKKKRIGSCQPVQYGCRWLHAWRRRETSEKSGCFKQRISRRKHTL